jgi:threonine dehydratase
MPADVIVLQARAVRDGLTFVAPYDDPHTIAGQGTIGDEILRQVSDLTLVHAGYFALHHQQTLNAIAASGALSCRPQECYI